MLRIYILLSLTLSSPLSIAEENFLPPKDGKIEVACRCVAKSTPLCQLKLFDAIAGQERYEWTQENYVKKGKATNLDEACYRKRDVEKRGDGMCCEVPGDESKTIKNMFRGAPNGNVN